MITLLIGENSFEIESFLGKIAQNFNGTIERVDGSSLQLTQLPDLLMGTSLFADTRVVVIRGLSQNKSIWTVFGKWIGKISDDIHLVLVEPKIDKRTATFKILKESTELKEFNPFSDRDSFAVEKWLESEACGMGLRLDKKSAQFLISRVGFDQWQLFHALKKLALVDEISVDVIKDLIEPNLNENVFNLFETALNGDKTELVRSLRIIEQSEDAYRLSALLFTQAFQLAAVLSAEKSDNVSKDFGIHPYVASKLSVIAKRLSSREVAKIIEIFTCADDDMKLSKADPWMLLEIALLKVASIKK